MEKPVRSLTVIRANNCVDRLELLREQVKESLDNDFVTILYTHGMPNDQVYRVTENLHGAAQRLHMRGDVDDVYGLALANRDVEARVHILVGRPVLPNPNCETDRSFGGLTIPFVADERLSAAFKIVERVTVCTVE